MMPHIWPPENPVCKSYIFMIKSVCIVKFETGMEHPIQTGQLRIICVFNLEHISLPSPDLTRMAVFGTFAAEPSIQHILYFAFRQSFDMITCHKNIKCGGD